MGTQSNPWTSVVLLLALMHKIAALSNTQACNSAAGDSFHNYGAKTINGTQFIPFSHYAGKHVLVVNVATY